MQCASDGNRQKEYFVYRWTVTCGHAPGLVCLSTRTISFPLIGEVDARIQTVGETSEPLFCSLESDKSWSEMCHV